MKQYINTALEKYIEKGTYPWHMPGHKRQPEASDMWSAVYAHDFTEAKDLDDMHAPEDFIADSLGELRRVYGTYRTYMLVNGSTSGIMTAVHSVCRRGDVVLVARNCHKAVYNAVCMLGLRPEYIMPACVEVKDGSAKRCDCSQREGVTGIPGDISCEKLKAQLNELVAAGKKPCAVVVTSPTYEGIISDIAAIAELLHRYGIYLIVDEAQGAHLRFMVKRRDCGDYVRTHRTAMECGADIVIESLHKTMPALTQTSLLHVMTPELDARVRRYLQIFQTSSPSYIFMQSMEKAVAFGENEEQAFAEYEAKLSEFRSRCGTLRNIRLLSPATGEHGEVCGYDEGRLVFVINNGAYVDCDILADASQAECSSAEAVTDKCTSAKIPLTGPLLADILADKYGLVVEMAAVNYVICISSVVDSGESYDILYEAVSEIDAMTGTAGDDGLGKAHGDGDIGCEVMMPVKPPIQEMIPGDAWNMPSEQVRLPMSEGRTAAEFVYAYPPGIPVVVPGELIDAGIVADIQRKLDGGLHVSGVDGGRLSVI